MSRARACRWLACAAALWLLAAPAPAPAHGGPPLRIGAAPQADTVAAARLALVHLREWVGFAVDWKELPDEAAVRAAFSAGRLDIAVVSLAPAAPAGAPAADCVPGDLARLGEELARAWGGAAFPLRLAPGPSPCARPALLLSRAVLDDPRFGILGKEAGLIAAALTRADLDAVEAAQARGGERAAAAAARAAFAAKNRR